MRSIHRLFDENHENPDGYDEKSFTEGLSIIMIAEYTDRPLQVALSGRSVSSNEVPAMKYLFRSAFTISSLLIILFASASAPANLLSDRAGEKIAFNPPSCPPNGRLDTSFNGTGMVTTAIGDGDDGAHSVAIQSDGKIVAAGFSYNFTDGQNVFTLARYNPDGTLDPSFGVNGKVFTSFPAGDNEVFSVAIQPDGKIIAAGATGYGQNYDFAVVRYNTNGTLDTTWGGTGKVTTSISPDQDLAESVAIQSDGRIVAAGHSGPNFALVRYTSNGMLDTSFGGTGIVTTAVGNLSQAYSVAIQSDGKIVAAGNSYDGFSDDLAVVRYNTNGTLDTSFGGTGKVTTSVGYAVGAHSLAIQTDGRIVCAGYSYAFQGAYADFAVVRYNTGGTLDTSWGGTGKVTTPIGSDVDFANSVAIQSDGKVVVAGVASLGQIYRFGLVRYNPNGTLDTSWGGTGKVITSVGSSYNSAYSVAIQPDGKIVAAGNSRISFTDYDFALVRYSGCGERLAFDYDDDQRADVSVFRPSNGVWYLLQSTAGFLGVSFGNATDKIAAADLDGDRKTDLAVYRPSNTTWYWLNSSNGALNSVQFGTSEDLPTPADYDGDGIANLAVFRPSNGTWYIARPTGPPSQNFYAVQFGTNGDKPTVGDFDGDGKADIAVFRPSTGVWYRLNSSNGQFIGIQFGLSTDLITQADFDGDGRTDIAVYRPSTGVWYWLNSSDGAFNAVQFGVSEDQPVAADYDGDGKADVAVFRPSSGVWYRLNSGNGSFFAVQFGTSGDRPTPAEFRY